MREPTLYHPLRGFSPYRALARRLRAQFAAQDVVNDAARAAALEAARAPEAPLAMAAGAAPPSLSENRRRRLRRRP